MGSVITKTRKLLTCRKTYHNLSDLDFRGSAVKQIPSVYALKLNKKIKGLYIATDKRGYPHNIFLISPRKHMLWVLIRMPRQGASNEYPQHMFFG